MIVGLTGGIGSGKTTVAMLFQKNKTVAVYIADVEATKIMNSSEAVRMKIIKIFGKCTYKDNQLDKQYLASVVFKDKGKLLILNSIVHPEVRKSFQKFIQLNTNKAYIIYESAILFESSSNQQCNFVITVFVDLEKRIQRILKRDKSTKKEILNRINNQWKEDKKLLQSNYLIHNNSFQDTEYLVQEIHNKLTVKTNIIL